MENLYDFYKTTRNNYFHNTGLAAYQLNKQKEAREIFEKVINLIKEVSDNKREVFKKLR